MKIRSFLFFATVLLSLSGFPFERANALDIPVLTWEQGKSQSVVLGDPSGVTNWDVRLTSDSGVTRKFRVSRSNSADFKVYTIDIPKDLPLGSYTVQTAASNYPTTIVANVLLIPQNLYEIPRAPIDLLLILFLFSVVIAVPSLLRAADLRFLRTKNQLTAIESFIDGQYWRLREDKIFNSLEIKRVESYELLRPSVFKRLLLIDGSITYKFKFLAFVILPVLSLCLSVVLFSVQHSINVLIHPITLTVIVILIAISIFDLYSGLVAAMLYATLSVVFYSQLGVTGLVQAILIAVLFVVPSAINLLGTMLISRQNKDFKMSWLYSLMGASFIVLEIMIIKSLDSGVLELFLPVTSISAIICLLARIKVKLILKSLRENISNDHNVTIDELLVVRVMSPLSIVPISAIMIVVFFNWSKSFVIAIFAAFFWTLPLLFSIIKFDNKYLKYLKNIPRNIYIELLVVVLGVIGIFYLSQSLPLLIQDRALLLMSLLALPNFIHAFFTALIESSRQIKEIIK